MSKMFLHSTDGTTLKLTLVVERLDSGNAMAFKEEWQNLASSALLFEKINLCNIDMGKVSFVDSFGISALLGVYKKCLEVRSKLKLSQVTQPVGNLIEQLRLKKVFDIEP